tara:strand:- start:646 stop:951 length:306 start_codon:yes stop_codon:yes gene_type:complete
VEEPTHKLNRSVIEPLQRGPHLKRIRKNPDGTETEFVPVEFDNMGPYRAEICVASFDELRELKKSGKLIALRMIEVDRTPGVQPQRNLAPWREIEDFDWEL